MLRYVWSFDAEAFNPLTLMSTKSCWITGCMKPTANPTSAMFLTISWTKPSLFLQLTAEAILRLVNDPVLPFYPLDIALDVQNKLKGTTEGDAAWSEIRTKQRHVCGMHDELPSFSDGEILVSNILQ